MVINRYFRKPYFFLFFVVLVGFFLRFSGIDYGLPSKGLVLTTYHPDEAIPIYTIGDWKPSKFYFHPGRMIDWGGFHLFPTAISFKIANWGNYLKVGSRDFYTQNLKEADKLYKIARFIQILCGVASLLVLFLMVRDSFGLASAFLATLFLTFSSVHIVNSFTTRPDIMMILGVLLSLFFSLKVWETAHTKHSIISGFFFGLSVATKYSAAPYGIFPLLIHIFSKGNNRKNLFYFSAVSLLFFVVGSPYVVIDFPWFYERFLSLISLTKSPIVPIIPGPNWKLYATYFIPYGIGWPLTIAGLSGWGWMIYRVVQQARKIPLKTDPKNRILLIWILSSFIIYLTISYPKSQQVWYTLPVVPLVIIFASYFCDNLIHAHSLAVRKIGILLSFLMTAYTIVYSLAYLHLFTEKNVREMASEWIKKNIPKGESIGIARSYFWTPGILRQYHPPYQLLKGGNDQSSIDDAVLGLEEVAKKAKYIVLTEFEYRTYLHRKLGKNYLKQALLLKNIMEKEYREVARFNQNAKFLWFEFSNEGKFPPFDWIMPNPTIIIFEKASTK